MSKAMSKTQTILLIALLVAVTLGAGALIWNWVVNTSKDPAPTPVNPPTSQTINSFQACVDAGYPVQQSYPEVCAAPGHGSFTNPNQSLN